MHLRLSPQLPLALALLAALTTGLPSPAPARAADLPCAAGPDAKARVLKRLEQNARAYYGAAASALDAAQARFMLALDGQLSRCLFSIGRAQLGGRPGTLFSALDPSQTRTAVFCQEADFSRCQIRLIPALGAETAWEPGLISSEPVARDFFAYSIATVRDGRVLATFFAPDITPFLAPSSPGAKPAQPSPSPAPAAGPGP